MTLRIATARSPSSAGRYCPETARGDELEVPPSSRIDSAPRDIGKRYQGAPAHQSEAVRRHIPDAVLSKSVPHTLREPHGFWDANMFVSVA
jgi:hypothetical protein